ncbi:MAG: ABC1 kinase family protein, partial [Acidimicrobiia bacterium]
VYRGVLRNGREVAVKVQRPGVAAATKLDMDILARVVKMFMKRAPVIAEIFQPDVMLEVVFSAMRPEVDFTIEAANIEEFKELLEDYGNLQVPDVIEVTKEVLVMSMAPGTSLRQCRLEDFSDKERKAIGRDIVTMVFRGFMVDGVFHGDPHPGNIFVSPGEPATILDFGIIGRIDRATRLGYTRFMLGMAMVDGEATGRAAIEMSTLTSRADVGGFLSDMQRWVPTVADVSMQDMEFGKSFNEIMVMCTRRGIAMNPAIALFGKATANMEGSLKRIAPEVTPFDVFRDSMGSILKDQVKSLLSGQETLRVANEAFFATRSIPEQLRFFAQSLVNGQYVLRIRDEAMVAHEAREDARAKAMRRTLLALGAAAMWLDHRRRRD